MGIFKSDWDWTCWSRSRPRWQLAHGELPGRQNKATRRLERRRRVILHPCRYAISPSRSALLSGFVLLLRKWLGEPAASVSTRKEMVSLASLP